MNITIYTTALLRTAAMLRRVLETRGDLRHPDFSERQPTNKEKKDNLPLGGLCHPGGPQSENKIKRRKTQVR